MNKIEKTEPVLGVITPKNKNRGDFTDCGNRVSNILKEDEIIQEMLIHAEKVLGDLFVRKRFYLLRHYPYIDDAEGKYREYCDLLAAKLRANINQTQLDRLILLEREIYTYERLVDIPDASELKNAIHQIMLSVKRNDGKFYYNGRPDSRIRNIVAGRDLIERYKIPKEKIIDVGIGSSTKLKSIGVVDVENIKEFNAFYANDIAVWANEKTMGDMVLLSNRSMSFAFGLCTEQVRNNQDDIEKIEKRFEKDGYLFSDYGNNGKLVKLSGDQFLSISPNNSNEAANLWKLCFPKNHFPDNLAHGQNILNAYLLENELQINCEDIGNFHVFQGSIFFNLIQNNKIQLIRNYYTSKDAKLYESGQKALIELYQNTNLTSDIQNLLANLFIFRDESWKEEWFNKIGYTDGKIDYKSLCTEREKIQKIMKESGHQAGEILERSLDTLVNEGKIYTRGLQYKKRLPEDEIQKQNEERQKNNLGPLSRSEEYSDCPIKLEDIASSSEIQKNIVLLGNVGEGKSTTLAGYYEMLQKSSPEILPLFYRAGTTEATIREDIEKIGLTDKKIVVIFDGFDEVGSSKKQSLREYLFSLSVHKVIIGSRFSGFDQLGGGEYTSVQFQEIPTSDRNKFLEERLRGLYKLDKDISEGQLQSIITTHLNKIQEFLEKGMLDNEIKNTPLILFLLCRLAKENPEELDKIGNKAQLYEKIIDSIIESHQKEKKTKFQLNKNPILKVLSLCAYKKLKSQPLTDKEVNDMLGEYETTHLDEYKAQLCLLFKNVNGSYEFIHNSFYEYFLAKYFAEDINGNQLLLKEQTIAAKDNWNYWREILRPIIFFYGQYLINTGEIDRFINFVGGEGILKDKDDIGGTNFFMGIELLSLISDNTHVQHQDQINPIFEFYTKKIDTEIGKILVKIGDYSKVLSIKGPIRKIFTPIRIKIIDIVDILIEEGNFSSATRLILEIIKTGDSEAIELAKTYERKLIEIGEFLRAEELIIEIIKTGDPEAIELVKIYMRKLVESGNFSLAGHLVYKIIETGDPIKIKIFKFCLINIFKYGKHKDINYAINDILKSSFYEGIEFTKKYIIKVIEVGKIFQIEPSNIIEIIKSGDYNAMKFAKVYFRKLVEDRNIIDAKELALEVIKIGNPEAIEFAKRSANTFMDMGEFLGAGYFALEVTKTGDPEAIEFAKSYTGILIKKGEFFLAGHIALEIAKTGDSEEVECAKSCVTELIKEERFLLAASLVGDIVKFGWHEGVPIVKKCLNEIVERKELNSHVRAFVFILTKIGDIEAIEFIKTCAKKLVEEGDFFWAGYLVLEFTKKGDSEAMELVKSCARKLMETGEFFNAAQLLLKIIKISEDKEIITIAKTCASKIMEKGDYALAESLVLEIIKTRDLEVLEFAKSYIIILIKRGEFLRAGYFALEVTKTGYPEAIEFAKSCASILMEKQIGFLIEVIGLLCEIIKTGDSGVIEFVRSCISKFVKSGHAAYINNLIEEMIKLEHYSELRFTKKVFITIIENRHSFENKEYLSKLIRIQGKSGIKFIKEYIDKLMQNKRYFAAHDIMEMLKGIDSKIIE